MQTINFPFLEPPLLVDGLGDSRSESCPADASAESSDRKGVSGALGRYMPFPMKPLSFFFFCLMRSNKEQYRQEEKLFAADTSPAAFFLSIVPC